MSTNSWTDGAYNEVYFAALEGKPSPAASETRSGTCVPDLVDDSLAGALDAVRDYLCRYVVFPSAHQPVAVALFAGHTHAIEAAETSPYLAATSAEPRSGKTKLLDCVEQLVAKPWRAINPSEAVTFRKIDQDHPTLLLDEVDAIFSTRRAAESNEGLRAILNAGNRRGTTVPRMVGEGRKMKVQDFDVFCAKALAGIGTLPDTVADRAIPIRLERRARSEKVERFRIREAEAVARPIREALADALEPLISQLAHARPQIPDALSDRGADGWEPLLAIADAAGGDWPAKARAAAVALSGERGETLDDAPAAILLLADLRTMFDRLAADRLTSAQVVAELVVDEERPWATWRNHDKPITAHGLARLLRAHGIRAGGHRFGDRVERGYLRSDLESAWDRYLPPPPVDVFERQHVNEGPSLSVANRAGNGVPVDVLTVGSVYRGPEEAAEIPVWEAFDPEFATDDDGEVPA